MSSSDKTHVEPPLTDNWKSALAFSVLVSLAFPVAVASLKLALIHTTEAYPSME